MKHAASRMVATCMVSFLLSWLTLAQQRPAEPAPAKRDDRANGKRAITFDDLIAMHRVSDVQISPDGKRVAYRVVTPDMEANRNAGNIWMVAASGQAQPMQLTRTGRDSSPRFSPDGKRLAFVSTRDGAPQIYLMSLEGGEATQLTTLSTGASEPTWSPDGNWIAFASEVYPKCVKKDGGRVSNDDECNRKQDEAAAKNPVKARVYDNLLYRHWDTWEDHKRSHLFVISVSGGQQRDLTPGADYDTPPVQRGGPVSFSWSPDGKEICYTAVAEKMEATSTNGDLFVVAADGSGEPKRITSNPAFDSGGIYSPDGRYIAYRAQERAGFEADRWQLMLFERQSGKHTSLTAGFDRAVDSYAWTPDSKTLYLNAEDKSFVPIFRVSAAGGAVQPVVKEGYHGEFALSGDGRTLAYSSTSHVMPAEIFAAAADGSGQRQLTRHNRERLAQLDITPAEHFWFEGADNTQVHAMLIRPPKFDAAKKYPLLLVMHGGPQTMFGDSWGYRWNPQVFAAPGYVALMINRRGSTGFGQKFTDEVTADWGGRAFQDLMKGVDAALEKYSFIDGTRMAAAGGSYGGYMAAWMASQSKGRFKAIIAHAAVYDLESMYGATEELWFPEWEFKGVPWENEEHYKRWSPHKRVGDFAKYKTPTLVIHGEQDYRVPYTQGLELFTGLQKQGVPSKLVIYPDEGHWILKPQNSKFWYATFLDWLATHLN